MILVVGGRVGDNSDFGINVLFHNLGHHYGLPLDVGRSHFEDVVHCRAASS